jgi:aminobenzoyl-glutamate utilization protein B
VKKVAEGAALMTETTVKMTVISAVSNKLGNTPLELAMHDAMQRLGPVPFSDADRAFAAEIQKTLSDEDIQSDYLRVGIPVRKDTPLCDFVVPFDARGESMIGSTDVADVSWVVPTVEGRVATHAIGTPGHSWQTVAQGKSPAAHKGMVHAAKIMAATAIEALVDPTLIDRAKADLRERTSKTPYVCPIPPDVNPPLQPRPADL